MTQELPAIGLRTDPTASASGKRRSLGSIAYTVFVAISTLAVFVPLHPRMPSAGLDGSWEFAMNEAVARHLSFGRAIVFTYGPYASIGTRTYSPATDLRMMLGSLQLAACYAAALWFLSEGAKRRLMVLLFLFLAAFGNTELLLLSYSFLLLACVVKYLGIGRDERAIPPPWWLPLAAAAMGSTLGLLPLVKGSLLLPYAASVAIASALFVAHSRPRLAFMALALPVGATLVYWRLAGQSISDLPCFLRGTVQLTAGYTEAMSTSWGMVPAVVGGLAIAAYLAASLLLCRALAHLPRIDRSRRYALAGLCALLLLVTFKHAFVAVANVATVFSTVSVLVLLVCLISTERRLRWLLAGSMLLSAVGSVAKDAPLRHEMQQRFGVGAAWTEVQPGTQPGTPTGTQAVASTGDPTEVPTRGQTENQPGKGKRTEILRFCAARAAGAYGRTTFLAAWNTYAELVRGLGLRLGPGDRLNAEFERAKREIRASDPLPPLAGSADFYEYEQSALLASGNDWNPRPVLQSYSAYTPQLAQRNEDHLSGPQSPDWVFFRLESIDGRWPSLDDGASWPALFDRYSLASVQNNVVLLRRKPSSAPSGRWVLLSQQAWPTGATVLLPSVQGLLFAQVDLRPTWAGRLLEAVFSPPQLKITVALGNGQTKSYRVVAEMISSGFVLSPLVTDSKEFAALADDVNSHAKDHQVRTFSIAPVYGGPLFWAGSYNLCLKEYAGR